MKKLICALSAVALTVPVAMPTQAAAAQTHAKKYKGKHVKHYRGRCRRSPGNTGLIVGGVAGALAGPAVVGHGLLGTVAGGVGGALGGRAIDRTITAKNRCR
ncbi:hypothetical protein AB2M62_15070 [Sphingomonas sp. MMS12-HWE2-04]|uniref:hypothetical protein n=1 Tax=Sphingomonas sp. MMS12-HWE2-04 TaxID=3234199 RepID=UPI0038501303